ncbi:MULTISPECIES: c-type cytochrome [unclassified Campylobacter]|uniref:cytochrome c4 n=1 Tax=unclassified Campylobacter TaxID=2593542 RepID=UPI00201684FE|nr:MULTISPECIES: c-type cytochrome [unclassified Campylobacter]
MNWYKISFLACFISIFGLNADEPSYIFEAKGEFAKELKALVEKYSKDENISINVYEKSKEQDRSGRFLNIGIDSNKKYSLEKGKELYTKNCARCHGENGEKRASYGSEKLTKLSADDIEVAFSGYLNDPSYGGSTRDIMKSIAATTTYNELGDIIVFLKGVDALKYKHSQDENTDVATTPNQGSYLR